MISENLSFIAANRCFYQGDLSWFGAGSIPPKGCLRSPVNDIRDLFEPVILRPGSLSHVNQPLP